MRCNLQPHTLQNTHCIDKEVKMDVLPLSTNVPFLNLECADMRNTCATRLLCHACTFVVIWQHFVRNSRTPILNKP